MVNMCVGSQLTRLAPIHSQMSLSEKIHAVVLVKSWNKGEVPDMV